MDAIEKLENLYTNFMLDRKYLSNAKRMRHLGGMEALLILVGALSLTETFNYKNEPITFKLFWLIPVSIPNKENYEQFILRIAYETIQNESKKDTAGS